MEHAWLKKEQNPDLLVYVLGWAATPNAVCHIDTPGCDVLAFYNYLELQEPPADLFTGYRRVYLFAWSFGVWVSEQYFRHLPLHKAIALNGTPFPVDERYGMRLRVVLRTMQALARSGGENAFAATADGSRYMPTGPWQEPTIEVKIDELNHLAGASRESSSEHIAWTRAYIADRDEIFPPARMRSYWATRGLGTEFSSYHYPFAHPEIVLDELD